MVVKVFTFGTFWYFPLITRYYNENSAYLLLKVLYFGKPCFQQIIKPYSCWIILHILAFLRITRSTLMYLRAGDQGTCLCLQYASLCGPVAWKQRWNTAAQFGICFRRESWYVVFKQVRSQICMFLPSQKCIKLLLKIFIFRELTNINFVEKIIRTRILFYLYNSSAFKFVSQISITNLYS